MPLGEKQESGLLSFLDVVLIIALVFVVLLALQDLSKAKKDAEKTKAEYVITVTWPQEFTDDVDTWLMDPLGHVLNFRNKEVSLMHLDRDDLGSRNDTVELPDGSKIKFPYNLETTTIRGTIAGEWVLNVHLYRKDANSPSPIPVTVKMERLNPTVKTVVFKTVLLTEAWQEITICRFILSGAGDILAMSDLPRELVKEQLQRQATEGH